MNEGFHSLENLISVNTSFGTQGRKFQLYFSKFKIVQKLEIHIGEKSGIANGR